MRFLYLACCFLLLTIMACDPCKDKTCGGRGTCVDGECVCNNPFGGANCETDLCEGIKCKNGGNCYKGNCKCTEGYEGDECDKLVTAKFVGTYSCQEGCQGIGSANYDVTIEAHGDVSAHEVNIYSLHSTNPVAIANGTNLTIASQQLQDGTIIQGNGSFSIDQKTLTINMAITPFHDTPFNCSFTLHK